MKLKKDTNNYSAEYIKKHRKFPVKNTVIIAVFVVIQLFLLFFTITAKAEPQDIIEKYRVTVEPLEDGSLDIEYSFLWKAVDETEELTYVEIGMANPYYTVYKDSLSGNIKKYTRINNDGYIVLRLDFEKGYKGGEYLEFSFKVNQYEMLCEENNGYLYEFVPGWFNSIPVENYIFKWKKTDDCLNAENGKLRSGFYTWTGALECGEYEKMLVSYSSDAFLGVEAMEYTPFTTNGAYNELAEERFIKRVFLVAGILLLAFVEVYLLDSHVSYSRGRGFLTSYGYPIHTYGFQNPRYIRAYNSSHAPMSGGRGSHIGGGGCACACACACAGGGRAGCSQKDTYTNIKRIDNQK